MPPKAGSKAKTSGKGKKAERDPAAEVSAAEVSKVVEGTEKMAVHGAETGEEERGGGGVGEGEGGRGGDEDMEVDDVNEERGE